LELAGEYYREVVAGLLSERWPGLPHAAARLGSGSEVLGLDDEVSHDHDFGLRLTLMVAGEYVGAVDEYLEQRLPETFEGWSTRFATSYDSRVRHKIEVATAEGFAASRLGVPVDRRWDALDWLTVTGQSVLEVTAGQVFVDTLGAISDIRRDLHWYPRDVWCHVVAADWRRIGRELPYIGRAGSRGDELGSSAVAGRLVPIAMHLGFLLESRWPTYPKWFGTCFATLPEASAAIRSLTATLAAVTWQSRQAAMVEALVILHDLQRTVGLPTGPEVVEPFIDRPFASIRASVNDELTAHVEDPLLRGLPTGVGSVEQCVDNVDLLLFPERRVALVDTWRSMIRTSDTES